MSAFGGLILTNIGRNLQAKAQAGATLNFTRIAIGDGDLAGSSIADLTALKHEIKSCAITRLKTLTGGKAVVGTSFSNSDIVSGFYWKELGVFAQDPDLGEILYCYGNSGANAEYIPAGGGPDIIEKSIDVVTLVGNASSITATIESSLVYASAQDLADLAGVGRTTETVKKNADDLAAHLKEPFGIKTATYDGVNNQVTLTIAKGIGVFPSARVITAADSTYNIAVPAINTTYYVYLLSDGTFTNNTTGAAPGGTDGSILLGTVATGATVDVLIIVDKRGAIDGTASALATHLADTVYQTAGGTATAITLTISETLVNGFPITFIASANNNAAATTINGKPLYKPNTTTAPNLIAGKAYTVWYNQANNCFFIKASAEGNATVGQVLAGATFSNDSDIGIPGAMPNKVGSGTVITPGTADIAIPQGYFGGALGDGKVVGDPNLIAANILSGKSIFGVAGTAEKKVNLGDISFVKGTNYKAVGIDPSGNWWVYDGVQYNGKAFLINSSLTIITTVTVNTNYRFIGISDDASELFWVDVTTWSIIVTNQSGTTLKTLSTTYGGTSGAVLKTATRYFVTNGTSYVVVFDLNGSLISSYATGSSTQIIAFLGTSSGVYAVTTKDYLHYVRNNGTGVSDIPKLVCVTDYL